MLLGPLRFGYQLIGAVAMAATVFQPQLSALDRFLQRSRCACFESCKSNLAIRAFQQRVPARVRNRHIKPLGKAADAAFGQIAQRLELLERLVRFLTFDL